MLYFPYGIVVGVLSYGRQLDNHNPQSDTGGIIVTHRLIQNGGKQIPRRKQWVLIASFSFFSSSSSSFLVITQKVSDYVMCSNTSLALGPREYERVELRRPLPLLVVVVAFWVGWAGLIITVSQPLS